MELVSYYSDVYSFKFYDIVQILPVVLHCSILQGLLIQLLLVYHGMKLTVLIVMESSLDILYSIAILEE